MDLRSWQKKSIAKISASFSRDGNEIMPVNACVGSGKTAVACWAIGEFIHQNINSKTIQIFSTPRIRLCDQQREEMAAYLEAEFGFKDKRDIVIIPVDCTKNEYNKWNENLVAYPQHVIFIICKESLTGKEEVHGTEIKQSRWNRWSRTFKDLHDNDGFKLGTIALDEAHNFEEDEDKLFSGDNSAHSMFKLLMMLSGTPGPIQKEFSKNQWKHNVCACSPKEAMENGWICIPNINIVIGNTENEWPKAIKAMLNREINICKDEVFKPRIMVNFGSIDYIKAFIDEPWVQANAGKAFHLITLHSEKHYDENNVIETVKPTIDLKSNVAKDAFEVIEKIDGNYFNDDLPIIVCQVQMLGEGINVKSFNSILTASNVEKTAMQQIGRCIRNFNKGEFSKINDGHANVYVLMDNMLSVYELCSKLGEYDLTDDCYRWGDRLDLAQGAAIQPDDNGILPELNCPDWDPIDPTTDLDIIFAMQKMKVKNYKKYAIDLCEEFFDNKDIDNDGISDLTELEELVAGMSKEEFKFFECASASHDQIKLQRIELDQKQVEQKKNNAKTSFASKKSNHQTYTPYMLLLKWIEMVHRSIHSSKSIKNLWELGEYELCMTSILQNPKIGKFLAEHISNDKLKNL